MIDERIYKRIQIHHYTYRVTISKRGKGGFGLFSPLSIYYILFFYRRHTMNEAKQEWDKHLTPKLGISDVMQRALDWWHELPIQNLRDMNDSWVGYLWKYYPDKSHPYHLTSEEVQHIYESEHVA